MCTQCIHKRNLVKNGVLHLRLSSKEKEELRKKSEKLGMTMSQYVRMKLFKEDEIEMLELKEKIKRWLFEVE